MATFLLTIVTPERTVYDTEVQSLVANAYNGYLGVHPGHAPMLVELVPGELRVVEADGREARMACSGGFMEVTPRQATVLADAVERAEEIDVTRAQAAAERARARIQAREGVDLARAQAALHRALNRLRVASEGSASDA